LQLSLDPISGQLHLAASHTPEECSIFSLAGYLDDLPPIERSVVTLLYGIGREQLDPELIAEQLNVTTTQVWLILQHAFEFVGQSVIAELAA
jgi:DNA-directed RNA polymerase specialized sigma24 family protein